MVSKEKYSKMVENKTKNSPILKDLIKAFLIGGAICTIGQLIMDLYLKLGLNEKDGATLTSVTLVFLGVTLTALHLYEKIAKHAGAGTLVPITGFANAVSSPAIEFKSEGFILGVGAKMFTIAGPVIVYGTTASVIYGIIYYIFTLFK
ncbi:MAG: stage V sporulation protein AC [Ruminococcus sp.]|nr:stage V sporulation protein AC [Ruminococcus sp.]